MVVSKIMLYKQEKIIDAPELIALKNEIIFKMG